MEWPWSVCVRQEEMSLQFKWDNDCLQAAIKVYTLVKDNVHSLLYRFTIRQVVHLLKVRQSCIISVPLVLVLDRLEYKTSKRNITVDQSYLLTWPFRNVHPEMKIYIMYLLCTY